MNFFYYLLEANLYLAVFYGFYRMALRKETFHTLNRFYFIIAPVLAFILPGFWISGFHPAEAVAAPLLSQHAAPAVTFNWATDVALPVYALVVLAFFARLIYQLYVLSRLIGSGNREQRGNIKVVQLEHTTSPFSFLNYLFIKPGALQESIVLRHEKVHIDQLHSADILYYEVLHALCWFNPLISVMQRELKAIHEFIADEATSREEASVSDYAFFLINHTGKDKASALVNPLFTESLLKERIVRLGQDRSPRAAAYKYLFLLLLLPVLVLTTSATFRKSYGMFDLSPAVPTNPAMSLPALQTTGMNRQSAPSGVAFADQNDTTRKKLPPPPPVPPKQVNKKRLSKKLPPPPPPVAPSKSSRSIPPPPPPAPPKRAASSTIPTVIEVRQAPPAVVPNVHPSQPGTVIEVRPTGEPAPVKSMAPEKVTTPAKAPDNATNAVPT